MFFQCDKIAQGEKMEKNKSKLGYLMDLFRIKGIDMANYLHVDDSLISKWKTGKRRLTSENEVLDEIVNFFIALDSSVEYQNILSILRTAYPSINVDVTDTKMKVLLKKWLLEEEKKNYFLSKRINNHDVSITQNVLYKGDNGRQRAAMDLIDLMLESPFQEELMIMDFDRFLWKYKDQDYHEKWFQKYEKIISKGHKITMLSYVDRKFEERLLKIKDWLEFYLQGNVEAYCISQEDSDFFRPSLLVLKSKVALFGMSARGFTNKMNVQITSDPTLVDHCTILFKAAKTLCKPMFEHIENMDIQTLIDKDLNLNLQIGEVIFKGEVPFWLFSSKEVLKSILHDNDVSEEKTQKLLYHYEGFNKLFEKHIRHFRHRVFLDEILIENAMIYQKSIVHQHLSTLVGEPVYIKKEYFCNHLKYMVLLMNSYRNFKLGFGAYRESDYFSHMSMFIKQHRASFVVGENLSGIHSVQPILHSTLYTYYDQLWNKMSQYEKSREVIEEKIKRLVQFHTNEKESSIYTK